MYKTKISPGFPLLHKSYHKFHHILYGTDYFWIRGLLQLPHGTSSTQHPSLQENLSKTAIKKNQILLILGLVMPHRVTRIKVIWSCITYELNIRLIQAPKLWVKLLPLPEGNLLYLRRSFFNTDDLHSYIQAAAPYCRQTIPCLLLRATIYLSLSTQPSRCHLHFSIFWGTTTTL